MKKAILFIILLTLSANMLFAQAAYQAEIIQWREKRETGLKAEDSWLSLAGLFWLKAGKNTLGSAKGNDIKLPDSTPAQVGAIDFNGGAAHLTVNDSVNVTSDKKTVHDIDLTSDEKGAPTSVELGDVSFTLIKREDRFGIRVKDKNNINRRAFKGLNWFPVDESFHIEADFVPYNEPKDVDIPNVLGGVYKMKSPGSIKFKVKGQEYSLQPVEEDDQLFIIFSDQTAKTTTYQSGRFLYTKRPVNGKVVLDFNEAYNPPCAFTEFATCPLPPLENKLKTAITAGEKRLRPLERWITLRRFKEKSMKKHNLDVVIQNEKRGVSAIGAKAVGAQAIGSFAIGAFAVGAAAIGALAIGKLVIGRLRVGKARMKSVEIDELRVRRLQVDELIVNDRI